MVLGWVVLALVAIAIITAASFQRSRSEAQRAHWEVQWMAVDALLESAAEEASLQLSEVAASPAHAATVALRDSAPGAPVPSIAPQIAVADFAALMAATGGTGTLVTSVTICDRKPLAGGWPGESTGHVRIVVRAAVTTRGASGTRVLFADRGLRVARTAPPAPLDRMQLAVLSPPPTFKVLKRRPIFAEVTSSPRRLAELLTEKPPVGVQQMSKGAVKLALSAYTSKRLKASAQLTFDNPERFLTYLAASNDRIDGVIHVTTTVPLRIGLPRFRGNAVICVDGDLHVGDIALADPAVDRLTLVATKYLLVEGRRVEAGLVMVQGRGIAVSNPCVLQGRVLTRGFPAPVSLGAQELADLRLEPAPIEPREPLVVRLSTDPPWFLHGDPEGGT